MGKNSNPKLIGGFVVGAIALLIIGAFAFGGGNFLQPKARAVLFFINSSLGGLTVGSPVTFRGIKVGAVTDIKIKYDAAGQELWIPVYIELETDKFEIFNGGRNENNILGLVKRGLRAQLEVQSMVTGQVNVNFDFHIESPLRLVGTERGIMELPTIPSEMSELKTSVAGVLSKINQLPLDKIVDGLNTVLQTADGTLKNVDAQVKPLAESFKDTSGQANRLLANVDADLPRLVAGGVQMMKSATTALNQADQTLSSVRGVISPGTPLYSQVNASLRELKDAASSIHILAEYIQRNPNAFLMGKK
jgi:phospholipid/cholesterol/gamma-HCH transport system substrate-binding protein